LYDPATEPEKAQAPSFYSSNKIDKKWHQYKDEGHYPTSLGTYHFNHRIDGKLVAVGVIDITKSYFNSAYFLYDPDYMFLNLGVMGAIREIEFIRMVRIKHNPDLIWY
jgi:arginyl-tRNA--protein-N-Asp/Glu arginylyltransferase